ncbi:MAG: hypothetical protein NC390_01120 [Fusobacterium sp.]|nr:hypothetical protein [Fusobacterium sp.]
MQVRNVNSILNNKRFLKTLEMISDHGTSFAAATSLAMSLTVRPLAILATPDTEKENKQYACANSIGSGLIKFGLVEAVALPIESAVKKIDKSPDKYLGASTFKRLAPPTSRSYKLGTQIMKLSTNLVTAIPKSMLTIAMIPFIMDKLFNNKKQEEKKPKVLSFGAKPTENLAKGIGKILDNEKIQNFLKKNEHNDKDIAKHLTAGTDILLTSSFAYMTAKSPNIKENRKKALIYNNVISTGITLAGGYGIDRLIKNNSENFIEKFKQANKGNPNLHKHIEGLHILRPALIFAAIYYGILPIFSTYISEKVDKYITKV